MRPIPLLLVVAVLAAGAIGYAAYLLYPRFDLPAVDAAGLLLLAVGAGAASFFSPCSFPLLATLLTRESGADREGGAVVLGRALVFAAALSGGAAAFLLLSGLVIALGGEALLSGVTFTSPAGRLIRAAVGILLVLLGLVQTQRLHLPFHRASALVRPLMTRQARLRRERPLAGFALFGFAYILAGFG